MTYCWWKKSGYPVEFGSLSHYLQCFINIQITWFLPSTRTQPVGLTSHFLYRPTSFGIITPGYQICFPIRFSETILSHRLSDGTLSDQLRRLQEFVTRWGVEESVSFLQGLPPLVLHLGVISWDQLRCFELRYTVDGSEMLRSPVEVGSLSHYLQGFSTIPGGCLGFLPSTVSLFGLGIFGFHISSRDGKPNIIGVMDLETALGTNFWRNLNQLKFWTFLKGTLPKTNCKSPWKNGWLELRTWTSYWDCRFF